MKNLIISFSAILIFCCACSNNQPKNKKERFLEGKCIGISDGDTFTILSAKNNQYKIRLEHVDCPEKSQPFSNNAKQFTSAFCFGKQIRIKHKGKKDRYERLLGVAYNEAGEELNKQLVEEGLAWHFAKYSKNQSYAEAEQQARAAHKGLWADPKPTAPWDWRKNK